MRRDVNVGFELVYSLFGEGRGRTAERAPTALYSGKFGRLPVSMSSDITVQQWL